MQINELKIPGSYAITPKQMADDRGLFLEWFRGGDLAGRLGFPMTVAQANMSVSSRGVVRGVHFSDVPPGQAKYVTVTSGAILDYVVDIRVGSATFGNWDSVQLDDIDRKAVYIGEGLGHAFVALSDKVTVSYLVSTAYAPDREHGINPLDPEIGLRFPLDVSELSMSPKDASAPGLSEAADLGLLPQRDEVLKWANHLADRSRTVT